MRKTPDSSMYGVDAGCPHEKTPGLRKQRRTRKLVAGVEGFEPSYSAPKTDVLTIGRYPSAATIVADAGWMEPARAAPRLQFVLDASCSPWYQQGLLVPCNIAMRHVTSAKTHLCRPPAQPHGVSSICRRFEFQSYPGGLSYSLHPGGGQCPSMRSSSLLARAHA